MRYKCIKGFSAITFEEGDIVLNIEEDTIWECLGQSEVISDATSLKSSDGTCLDICDEMLTKCFELYKE